MAHVGHDAQPTRLGCDLDQPHLVLAASPSDDRFDKALRAALPGAIFDRRDDSMRALLRVPTAGEQKVSRALRAAKADVSEMHRLDGLRLAVY